MAISAGAASLIRNRRAELWICQRYDLTPGEQTHDYSLAPVDAGIRYRAEVDEIDTTVARLYWNAVWFEGASSPVLRALRIEGSSAAMRRKLVVLASAADASAEVSPESFLPSFVLPGLLESASADSAYGGIGRRARESLAWTYASKIVEFPGSVLVVVGAETAKDLELLWEVLSEAPVRDLTVLVAWPGSEEPPAAPGGVVKVEWFDGDSAALLAELNAAGAPSATTPVAQAIRIGRTSLPLEPQDTQFIAKRMALVYETAFSAPTSPGASSLDAFFDGSTDDWSGYATGVLPIPRSYRTDLNVPLADDVLESLAALSGNAASQRTFVYQVPAESASGVTTMLRVCAYRAAEAGFPSLIARSDQTGLDLEDLTAFLTVLNDKVLALGAHPLPPVLIVVDVEHTEVNESIAQQIAQAVAAQGRRAVVLSAIRIEGDEERSPSRSDRWATLPSLRSGATDEEVLECATRFSSLARDWSLASVVQSVEDWKRYESSNRISGPNRTTYDSDQLFWVAIRFFVCEGATFLDQESLRASLGNWITKRTSQLESEDSKHLVNYVAGLSSFRLVSPLTTVLRPITGSIFSSNVVDTLQQLKDIVDWKDYSVDLDDQVLSFRHPAIAVEYLRSIGISNEADTVRLVRPVIESLSPGGRADLWLAEMIASTVLAPESRARDVDWRWRLEAFDWIPASISERSKAILHHWARCLSRSTHNDWISVDEKRTRLTAAIDRLQKALELERRPGRDEHPAHMFNTLGAIYNDLALFLESQGDSDEAIVAWDKACDAFESSLALLPGDNVIAYLAFSNRLLRHAGVWPNGTGANDESTFRDIAHAVALLDEADEQIVGLAAPDPSWRADVAKYKSAGLRALGGDGAAAYIEQLKQSDDPSLGFYCEARLKVGESPAGADVDEAAMILTGALDSGIALGPDALRLLAQLLRQSPTHEHDYAGQARIYRLLERAGGTGLSSVDMFRLAVLCYQTEDFPEGGERFRKIRELVRQAQSSHAPQRVSDLWRDSQGKPRIVQVRIDKAFTDWRGEGYVDAIGQSIPLRPRHFQPLARLGEFRECMIRFEIWGPLAVPVRSERP